ncbi:Alpha/Beta hydrolase protein [Panaeolus papilionaceus]|nr:Alpha/Beta hydrolase protein [Panaeolus papilionaceus]
MHCILDDDVAVVDVKYSVRDHVRNVKRTMEKTISFSINIDDTTSFVPTSGCMVDIGDSVAEVTFRPDGLRANFRVVKGSSTKRIIEFWRKDFLAHSLDVTSIHGDFYTDEYLGSFSFSKAGDALVYIAEQNAPDTKDPFERFRFNPDFGEGLVGKKLPGLYLLKLDKDLLSEGDASAVTGPLLLRTTPGIRFGQATFSLTSSSILYATGYEFTIDGRILGPKGCFNRPTGIWEIVVQHDQVEDSKIPTKVSKISPPNLSCRSPRVVENGTSSKLIWLSCPTGGAHISSSTLFALDVPGGTGASALIDAVAAPSADAFPGLYPPYNLPTDFILRSRSSEPLIIVQSQWHSRNVILSISSTTGLVDNLTPDTDDDPFNWSVLATDADSRFIAYRSSASVPYELVVGQMKIDKTIVWTVIDRPALSPKVTKALASIRTTIIPIPGKPSVETIVIQSSLHDEDGKPRPCITSPHGGPHGTTSTAFSATTTALVLEGYTLSFPNYTGSPGFGEDFLQALIGRCGELDVQDCIAAAQHLVSLGISEEGAGKQLITGGSHGGFLTAHLIGQFPDFFSAAIMRNPVIAAGNVYNTDIPDWYYSEFGFGYPLSSSTPSSAKELDPTSALPLPSNTTYPSVLSAENYGELQQMSPTRYIDDIRVPVLLLIGAVDRRVAPAQGIEFYHALRGKRSLSGKTDVDVEMLVFPDDSHPLDGVEAAKAGFYATISWFANLGPSKKQ